MKCKSCGKTFGEHSKFCPYCGTPLEAEEQPMFCSKCGNPLNPGATFCRKCGAPVRSAEAPKETGGQQHRISEGFPASDKKNHFSDKKPMEKKKRKQLIAAAATVAGVVCICLGLFFMMRSNLFAPRAKSENGVVQMDEVSVDFGSNHPADGEVRMMKLSASSEEKELGIVGDVYVLDSEKNYEQPVTLTMPVPEEYDPQENEVIHMAVFVEGEMPDGSVKEQHFFAEPQMEGEVLKYTFVPSQIMDQPDVLAYKSKNQENGKVDRSRLHIKYGTWRGIFCENDATASFDGGHFKLYISHKDAVDIRTAQDTATTEAGEHTKDSKIYERVLRILEDTYSYYYDPDMGLGYECLCPEDLFPLPVYFTIMSDADGLFIGRALGVGHPYMELNINSFLFDARIKISQDAYRTAYHEMFHCVQRGYNLNMAFHTSPFFEATATYYESKVFGDVAADNFAKNIWMSYSSLFGNYGLTDWFGGARHDAGGYGLAGLIHYVSQKNGSDEWIAQVLSQGAGSAEMAAVLSDYDDWAEDYYLSQTLGRIPCKESAFRSAKHIYTLAEEEKCGTSMKVEIPKEKEIEKWMKEQQELEPDEEREPFVLGEASVDVYGKAAQIITLKVEGSKSRKIPEEASLGILVEEEGFHVTPIHLESTNVRDVPDLSDLKEDLKDGEVNQGYYELMVYSDHPLDEKATAHVKVVLDNGIPYDEILGSYQCDMEILNVSVTDESYNLVHETFGPIAEASEQQPQGTPEPEEDEAPDSLDEAIIGGLVDGLNEEFAVLGELPVLLGQMERPECDEGVNNAYMSGDLQIDWMEFDILENDRSEQSCYLVVTFLQTDKSGKDQETEQWTIMCDGVLSGSTLNITAGNHTGTLNFKKGSDGIVTASGELVPYAVWMLADFEMKEPVSDPTMREEEGNIPWFVYDIHTELTKKSSET